MNRSDFVRMLHQRICWEQTSGTSNRGDRTYGAPVTVRGRASAKLRDVFSNAGEVTTVTTQVLMLEQPAIGDLLDGREVVTVTQLVDYRGQLVGYQALTR